MNYRNLFWVTTSLVIIFVSISFYYMHNIDTDTQEIKRQAAVEACETYECIVEAYESNYDTIQDTTSRIISMTFMVLAVINGIVAYKSYKKIGSD